MNHNPLTAAKAVRAMSESGNCGRIAKTWQDYVEQQKDLDKMRPADRPTNHKWLTSYMALMFVSEQCNGVQSLHKLDYPRKYSGEQITDAIAEVMPELFSHYWSTVTDNSNN